MSNQRNRPRFLESWIDDIRDDVSRSGARALVPWTAMFCLVVGSLVAWVIPEEGFWDKPEISMVFFTAILTLNGLLLALSWSSFGKIYEIAARPQLAKFLRAKKLLQQYIFYVDFIHYTQVFALAMSAISLVACVAREPPLAFSIEYISMLTIQRTAMFLCVSSSIYALRYALGAVRIMQDLVWHASDPKFADPPELTVHSAGNQH